MKKIAITIDQLGKSTIDAQGFNGQGCLEATKNLEAVLGGGEVVSRTEKPEIFNNADEQETQHLRY